MHLFAFILSDKLLEISFFNDEGFHTVITSERPLRSSWGKSSISFLLVMLENRAKSAVIKTFSCNTLDHSLNIKGKFKFSLDGFDQSCFSDSATLVNMSSECYKCIHYIRIKNTVFVVLSEISSVVLFSFFFYLSCVVQKYVHIKHSNLFMGDFLVNLVFSIVLEIKNGS